MSDRRMSMTAKAIEAALFFGHALGPPTFHDEAHGFRWEWAYDPSDGDFVDEDLEHLIGQWVILSVNEAGDLHAVILSHRVDRTMQFTLAGFCASNGISYTTELPPNGGGSDRERTNVLAIRDHQRKRKGRH